MPNYRMSITARVCFDVNAQDDAEAMARAEKELEKFEEGVGLHFLTEGVLYMNNETESPEIDDITDDEPEAS